MNVIQNDVNTRQINKKINVDHIDFPPTLIRHNNVAAGSPQLIALWEHKMGYLSTIT
jgi:hypothetical protein